jgi:hypothetical protein
MSISTNLFNLTPKNTVPRTGECNTKIYQVLLRHDTKKRLEN